jgi:hypothetical protein
MERESFDDQALRKDNREALQAVVFSIGADWRQPTNTAVCVVPNDGIGLRVADRPSRRSGRHRHLIDGPEGHPAA